MALPLFMWPGGYLLLISSSCKNNEVQTTLVCFEPSLCTNCNCKASHTSAACVNAKRYFSFSAKKKKKGKKVMASIWCAV